MYKSKILNEAIECVREFNSSIEDSLGDDYFIGHSYFTNLGKDDIKTKVIEIVETEILPLIKEYLVDSPDVYEQWEQKFRDLKWI